MRGKIIKGIAGFYYVCGMENAHETGIGHGTEAGRERETGHGTEADRETEAGHGTEVGQERETDHGTDIVHTADTGKNVDCARYQERIYECKAKGIFRKDKRKPLVGDEVEMDVLDEKLCLGNIRELLPRRSELIRPAVANVDQALVIFSIAKPSPNFNLLDRFLIMMEQQNMECIVCFNKLDMEEGREAEKYIKIYKNCGYQTIGISAMEGKGICELRSMLEGKTTTVAGPSGVGKSTLINRLQSNVIMETGQISEKIGRGKHTTRHSELLALGKDTYILDTPGFSSLDLFALEKERLGEYYPEFGEFEQYCRFRGCSHVEEKDCGVKKAVEEGYISQLRYENYVMLYGELKGKKVRY